MKLYDLLEKLDYIITPYTTEFSERVKYTADVHSCFIDTYTKKRRNHVPDCELGEIKWIAIAFSKPFKRDSLLISNHGFFKNSIRIMYNLEDFDISFAQDVLEKQGFQEIRFIDVSKLMTLLA